MIINGTIGNDLGLGSGSNTDDDIYGGFGNDTIISGGADHMYGGFGDDTFYLENAGDVAIEYANQGWDTVVSSFDYTLGENSNIENLTLAGSAINGTGNSFDNSLKGNSLNNMLIGGGGNDSLDGGLGIDTMIGGTGNDKYWVNGVFDQVVENANEGVDKVYSSLLNYTLGANFENLSLYGFAINGTGNDLDNYIYGNSGANVLTGGGGNDKLDGGTGADTMIGGIGDDTYYVDNGSDVVTENAGEGTDLVRASVSHALGANVENLSLQDIGGAITGFGNNQDNDITGNSSDNILKGGGGSDYIVGGAGADTMYGGTGDDTFWIDQGGDVVTENGNEGTDRVYVAFSYTLGANVENLILLDTGGAINGTGNGLDNTLYGNIHANVLTGGGGNDTLNGGGGNDTMIGGTGDDLYTVHEVGDIVTENANEGLDWVGSSITYTLGANVEGLFLQDFGGEINGTGNGLDNGLVGNSFDNTLIGGGGNDRLYGEGGADTMFGGIGDDAFHVDDAGDQVIEFANEGTETVYSTALNHTLGANVENITLIGTGINATGNDLDNRIEASGGSNILTGGAGDDHFVFSGIDFGQDTVTDFAAGDAFGDVIDLQGFGIATFAELQPLMSQVGSNVLISLDVNQTITLQNVGLGALNANDFLFS